MTPTPEVRWIATISDGSTAVEHSGEYTVRPGERKPWVRLCTFLAENDLHLTSLRLNLMGRTIHLPRSKFDRFDMNERSRAPHSYSLQYHIEGELDNGTFSQTQFVDLAAHYDGFSVHYVQDITDGNNSWVIVTEGDSPLAETPRRTEK